MIPCCKTHFTVTEISAINMENFNVYAYKIRRRKRFDIHLLTKMSDMTRRFEVIMTSFSSDKRNGQVQVQN